MSPPEDGATPWLIHYFQHHPDDDASSAVPARDFLESLPPATAADFGAVLDAVAKAPLPAFSGGGKWEAMHGNMGGIYEVRITSRGANHASFACWYEPLSASVVQASCV